MFQVIPRTMDCFFEILEPLRLQEVMAKIAMQALGQYHLGHDFEGMCLVTGNCQLASVPSSLSAFVPFVFAVPTYKMEYREYRSNGRIERTDHAGASETTMYATSISKTRCCCCCCCWSNNDPYLIHHVGYQQKVATAGCTMWEL